MQFRIDSEKLVNVLQNVSHGLSTKTPMPILTGIQIVAKDKTLIFTTTNKEISVRVELPEDSDYVTIYEEGECVVPGKYFLEIAKKVEGLTVDFSLYEESTIKIVSEKSDFTLIAFDKTNFPVHNFAVEGTTICLESQELKQIIKQTSFAAATSESRIILTSVNFNIYNDKLEIISTDSFRLAKKILAVNLDVKPVHLNIPCKALDELNKILDSTNKDVYITFGNNRILFAFDNTLFMTRLVEGNYPNTNSLFPSEYLFTVKFNRNELIKATDRASLFIENDNVSKVKLRFTTDKRVEISSDSTEMGKVVEEIYPLEVSEPMSFEIAFSPKYLMDALKSFDSEVLAINFTGEIKPAIIHADNDLSLMQLLLPVRYY